MRVVTWNVNGLRAAVRKGFTEHIARLAPDVLMLQEVRALPEQLDGLWGVPGVNPDGYHVVWHPAQRKGYAGTAIWSRQPIKLIGHGLGPDDDDVEGRVIHAETAGVYCVCVYLPKGEADTPKQARKERWMAAFHEHLLPLRRKRKPVIVGGDLNIAHTERDLYYARSNRGTSGFLPGERAWFDELLAAGWRDVVRQRFGDMDGPYSWWSNRGRARELDRGWRIDYLLAGAAADRRITRVGIDRPAGLACSDHAPVWADLDP